MGLKEDELGNAFIPEDLPSAGAEENSFFFSFFFGGGATNLEGRAP